MPGSDRKVSEVSNSRGLSGAAPSRNPVDKPNTEIPRRRGPKGAETRLVSMTTIALVMLVSALVGLVVACMKLLLVTIQIVHEVIKIRKTLKDN